MIKPLSMLAVLMICFMITACSKIIVPRPSNVYPGGITNPNFTTCRHAINHAYQQMVALKKNPDAKIAYCAWSELNDQLASALSAMEFGQYKQCIAETVAINNYIAGNLSYLHWKSGQKIQLTPAHRF